MADGRQLVMNIDDYSKLRGLQNHAKALELVKKAVESRDGLPRSDIYLDGSFISDEGCQVPEYVISPLYISLQNESVDAFQHLLTLCPILLNELLPTIASNLVVYCYDCETLLHLACRKELIEIIQYLLKRGANTEIKGCRIGTPLHIAAEHGKITAIRLLLDSGADIEARDCSGNTPLHLAVAWDMLAAVHLLLDRGADINATSYFGDDVFSIAISRAASNVLIYLCNRDTSRVFSSPGASPAGKILPSPPLLLLLAASSKKKSISVLFNQLIALPECPLSLKVDALLIDGCCGLFSTNSEEKFRHALRMKQDLGQHKVLPSPPWYGGQLEVQSVEEWDEMQARELDFYLQSCIILDRCLGSDHPMVYQRVVWFIDYCASRSLKLDCISKLQLRCLDMFVSRECLKLDYCSATPFQAQQLVDLKKYVSLDTYEEWIGQMLKGLEVFAKMREKHTTCTFFKLSPTPFNDPFIKLMETILNLFHAWISGEEFYQETGTNCGLTRFRDLVEKFVSLCNLTVDQSLFNVTWPNATDRKSQNSLKFLLKTLLNSEAVSFINMANPRTGLRPLHKAFDILGSEGLVLMLSHGAHLDACSRKHYTFLPGKFSTSALINPVYDSELSSLISSPLPLLCQCSWAIIRYKMPYRKLNLPSRIKDYIALHETV